MRTERIRVRIQYFTLILVFLANLARRARGLVLQVLQQMKRLGGDKRLQLGQTSNSCIFNISRDDHSLYESMNITHYTVLSKSLEHVTDLVEAL